MHSVPSVRQRLVISVLAVVDIAVGVVNKTGGVGDSEGARDNEWDLKRENLDRREEDSGEALAGVDGGVCKLKTELAVLLEACGVT